MKLPVTLSLFLLPLAQAVSLQGAGASFPYPLYSKWFAEYKKLKNIEVGYQSIGSGGGQRQILAQTVDFGATDQPMSDQDLQKAGKNKILHIPTAVGAVVVSYHLPGLKTRLKFSGPVLAEVFMGSISRWNDPRLVKLNPGVKLPPLPISVVRRADGSGSTHVFTDFLSGASQTFARQVGRSQAPNWSPNTIGAKGNDGVASVLKQTPGSIGYVELLYARQNRLPDALIQNRHGEFVEASISAIQKAAEGVKLPGDTRTSLVGVASKGSYPLASYTYLLVYQDQDYNRRSLETARALKQLLQWMVQDAQRYNEPLGYARLSDAARKRALALIGSIHHGKAKL